MGAAVARALASNQCGPGSNPGVDTICGLSLLLVLSFAPRGFSPGTLVFPSPQKPTFANSNSTRNQVDEEPQCGCATSKSLFIFIYLFYLSPIMMSPSFPKLPKWIGMDHGISRWKNKFCFSTWIFRFSHVNTW